MKRLILTGYVKDIDKEIYSYTSLLNKAYADIHGFEFINVEYIAKSCMKINIIKDYVDTYDEIMWIDPDAAIVNRLVNTFDYMKTVKRSPWVRGNESLPPVCYAVADIPTNKNHVAASIFLVDCINKHITHDFLRIWYNDCLEHTHENEQTILNKIWIHDILKSSFICGLDIPTMFEVDDQIFIHFIPQYGIVQPFIAKKYIYHLMNHKNKCKKRIGIYSTQFNDFDKNYLFLKHGLEATGHHVDLLSFVDNGSDSVFINDSIKYRYLNIHTIDFSKYCNVIIDTNVKSNEIIELLLKHDINIMMYDKTTHTLFKLQDSLSTGYEIPYLWNNFGLTEIKYNKRATSQMDIIIPDTYESIHLPLSIVLEILKTKSACVHNIYVHISNNNLISVPNVIFYTEYNKLLLSLINTENSIVVLSNNHSYNYDAFYHNIPCAHTCKSMDKFGTYFHDMKSGVDAVFNSLHSRYNEFMNYVLIHNDPYVNYDKIQNYLLCEKPTKSNILITTKKANNPILFTSCFYDIGRKDWGSFSRSYAKYIEHFNHMIDDGFNYPLIVYTHNYVIKEMMETRSYPSNILFIDISGVDTFLKEPYLSNEHRILNNTTFQNKIPDFRKGAIEHTFPKYTLLTHSKICFIKHTRKLFDKFDYYAWIDFGYPKSSNICNWPVCKIPSAPKNINMDLLERKIHCGTIKILNHRVSESEFLACNWFTIYAFSFIIHTDIFDEFYKLYKEKLEKWQLMNHADDEQNLLYQLYQDRKDLFKMFKIKDAWGFYPENFNPGARPSIF
jgi:hypothetical protein